MKRAKVVISEQKEKFDLMPLGDAKSKDGVALKRRRDKVAEKIEEAEVALLEKISLCDKVQSEEAEKERLFEEAMALQNEAGSPPDSAVYSSPSRPVTRGSDLVSSPKSLRAYHTPPRTPDWSSPSSHNAEEAKVARQREAAMAHGGEGGLQPVIEAR